MIKEEFLNIYKNKFILCDSEKNNDAFIKKIQSYGFIISSWYGDESVYDTYREKTCYRFYTSSPFVERHSLDILNQFKIENIYNFVCEGD